MFLPEQNGRLEPALVDLEGVRFPGELSGRQRLRALAELNASLPDALPAELRCAAFRRYARIHPFPGGTNAALRRVLQASLARRHRFRGVGCALVEGAAGQDSTLNQR